MKNRSLGGLFLAWILTMANMSYCRFENTFHDLEDCQEALFENGLDGLSETETKYAKRLIEVCMDIVESHSDLVEEDICRKRELT